jgi:tripartite-type tricarboxylate transporter receptor subunit TctC
VLGIILLTSSSRGGVVSGERADAVAALAVCSTILAGALTSGAQWAREFIAYLARRRAARGGGGGGPGTDLELAGAAVVKDTQSPMH